MALQIVDDGLYGEPGAGLSIVRQPVAEKGRLAAGLLVSLLEDESGREMVLPPAELVLRHDPLSVSAEPVRAGIPRRGARLLC